MPTPTDDLVLDHSPCCHGGARWSARTSRAHAVAAACAPALLRFGRGLAPVVLLGAALAPAGAQVVREDPGVMIGHRIVVVATVTLSDRETPYHPVAEHELVLRGARGDSLVAITDAVGIAKFRALPGAYRLTSRTPYRWRGATYRWSVAVRVVEGVPAVDLTGANAEVVRDAAGGGRVGAPVPVATGGASAARTGDTGLHEPRETGTGVFRSVLFPGGGQFYASRPSKGTALLVGSLGAFAGGAAISVGTCRTPRVAHLFTESCDNTAVIAGSVLAATLWLYSIGTASSDVRAWNRAHALRTGARLWPVIRPGASGTRVGLAARW